MSWTPPRASRRASLAVRRVALVAAVAAAVAAGGTPASPAAAASIRPDGLLEIGGAPVFPVGLVDLGSPRYADWEARIAESGANFVWDIEIAYADTTPSCAAVMAAAAAGGWHLLVGSGDTWNWDDPATPELEVDQPMYEAAELDALLDCAAAHPDRVVAFANRDEPSWTISRNMIGDIDEAHIRATYPQLRTAAPSAVVAMNHAPAHVEGDLEAWKQEVSSWATATDVVMFASYPYPPGPGTCTALNVLGYPECRMDRLVTGADLFLSELNLPGQPLWMIVQAHKGIPLKEARWEAWASIVHGATGIFWAGWTWYHAEGGGEENWPITRQVVSEVAGLTAYLVGTDLPGATCSEPDVDFRVLQGPDRRAVLVAISRNGFTGEATFELPLRPHGVARVLHEGRHLPIRNGRITDSFDGYEAHVYEFAVRERVPAPAVRGQDPAALNARMSLAAAPSPTAAGTRLSFSLPEPTAVRFSVHDASGRRVAVLARGRYDRGPGEMVWDGRDAAGRLVAPGVYFVRAETASGAAASARVLVRR